ncbi:periplasmic heavy metal sensor [Neotabrizicola shimadae]|uniref:Periplasmic heavy metal sensor n=1 Tax=Neotabrizicola shimadae TaxID=2807096 RepID=A0A8G0ZS82_9RHOB|nr:periplasmic heavy metal sensor [Neotabrizicola shimadae]QYZ68525.1 periplasmic heavy metal sensor [Neotabrizicola shimadae]
MSETQAAPPVPSRRGLKIALAVSVALNLAVAGLVAGAVLKSGPMRDQMVRDLGFGPFAEALSDSDRKELRRAFVDRSPGLRDLRETLRKDMAGVLAALRAQPFDPAALRAALEVQTERLTGQMQMGQLLLAERIDSMSEAERLAFADRLEESMKRGRGKKDDKSDGGKGKDD